PAPRAVSAPNERAAAGAFRSSAPPPPRTKPPPPHPGLAADLTLRWTEVIDRAEMIDRSDYFAMLDIARDATQKDVRDAFLALAKRWHPDRLPPELAPVREACSRVFARMNEAHATLADEEKRPRYMRLLADGSGSPEMQDTVAKIVEAATNFQKAEVCFKRQDYVQAETLCRSALRADPTQPDYLAMHAWLLSLRPENQGPEQVASCIQKLDRAIAMSDKCERAYFWRGLLQKRIGKATSAQRDFRHVIELNPRNIDAAREVRLHQMRGGAPASDDSDTSLPVGKAKSDDADRLGILGRLFKKT
ncbi:MAG: J domain-containing protein, partial [Polyangiaceae bacterium]